MSRQTLISLLQAVTALLLVLALTTLMPYQNNMVSDLGYHTLCPFAPWSTMTLVFLAGVAWIVRQHAMAQND